MIKERILLTIIWILIAVTIWFSISGCALVEQVSDVVFGSKPELSLSETQPETPKAQLWQTIKGMTPNWLAIPVIALGAVAMFNGAFKLGMSCVIFGSVNLFMALATSRFGFWMAVCGLMGSCAAIAVSILVKNKALKDMIFGIQTIKQKAKEWKTSEEFQVDIRQPLKKQVKSTQKIVQKIKSKAKLRGEL